MSEFHPWKVQNGIPHRWYVEYSPDLFEIQITYRQKVKGNNSNSEWRFYSGNNNNNNCVVPHTPHQHRIYCTSSWAINETEFRHSPGKSSIIRFDSSLISIVFARYKKRWKKSFEISISLPSCEVRGRTSGKSEGILYIESTCTTAEAAEAQPRRNYMRIFYDFQFSWHRCFMICEIHYFPTISTSETKRLAFLPPVQDSDVSRMSATDDGWSFSIQQKNKEKMYTFRRWRGSENVIESENLCDGVCLMIYEEKDKYKIGAITRQWWQSGSGNVAGNGNKFSPDFIPSLHVVAVAVGAG